MFPPSPTSTSPAPSTPESARPRPRLPSFSDGLGDRVLVFDAKTASWMELLRFKREFSHARGFFNALKTRIDVLSPLEHEGLAKARTVEWLAGGEGLALVSSHTPGKRLSELTADARGPQFAQELVGQLSPALATLHRLGANSLHGAVTADRIVVTPEGRLVLTESVLGAGLNALQLPASRLQAEMHIAVPFGPDPVTLDARGDVIQLGLIALGLMLGRKLDPADFPVKTAALLAELAAADRSPSAESKRMQQWLGRALQVGDRPFANAIEADEAFAQALEAETTAAASTPAPAVAAAPISVAPAPSVETKHVPVATAEPVSLLNDTGARVDQPSDNDRVDAKRVVAVKLPPAASMPAEAPAESTSSMAFLSSTPAASVSTSTEAEPAAPPASGRARWLTMGLGVTAAVEAAVIVGLLYMTPKFGATSITLSTPPQVPSALALVATVPSVPQPAAPQTQTAPAATTPVSPPAAQPANEPAAPAASASNDTAAPAAQTPAPLAGRVGGVKVNASFDLQVFENGAMLGTTAGPIALTEGSHTLELVNDTLAFRFRQTVTVKAGQLTPLAINPPNGRININAVPWASVTIDGAPAGDTPLANLSIPIGTHEIVFSHPQFGTQKQTVVVKADGPARASATMQRSGGGQ